MVQQYYSWTYNSDKTVIQEDICTPIFTTALLTIAKAWKQPNIHQ